MYCKYFLFFFIIVALSVNAQKKVVSTFKVVPLGVMGGSDESNLSAYMVAPERSDAYVCLDAGTLHAGINTSIKAGLFKATIQQVLRDFIKGYCISHAHLDHVAGLIINSPDDTAKNIYGLPFCLDIIKDKYFTWKNWANFANEGDKPALNKYHYSYLSTGEEMPISNTGMHVTAFTLSHSNPYQSTAFLIRQDSSYLLYLGDTGADEIEKSDNLHQLWKQIAPLIMSKKLKGLFIEVSFPNEQKAAQLFGHLTPKLLMNEMNNLAALTGKKMLQQFKVCITHIKPLGNSEAVIKKQLEKDNLLNLQLIFPQQAHMLRF